mmetsp:Transcript_91228/g.143310  ORF Transcript_91228/g.143310 Transcript_91228/m.143310 type:complete len:198 (-) Transcript_91228:35-628(-)
MAAVELTMITERELAEHDGSSVGITFEPGPLGLTHDSNGEVLTVDDDGQAKRVGVQVGWKIENFNETNLQGNQGGSLKYNVTFRKACWIVMHHLVFKCNEDLLNEHPGGPDVITLIGGRDATQEFEDIAHSDSAIDWANKLIIGYIEGAPDHMKTATAMPNASAQKSASGGSGFPVVPTVVVGVVASALFMFLRMRR